MIAIPHCHEVLHRECRPCAGTFRVHADADDALVVVYSQLDESEGDGQEMRVDRCDVLCGGAAEVTA